MWQVWKSPFDHSRSDQQTVSFPCSLLLFRLLSQHHDDRFKKKRKKMDHNLFLFVRSVFFFLSLSQSLPPFIGVAALTMHNGVQFPVCSMFCRFRSPLPVTVIFLALCFYVSTSGCLIFHVFMRLTLLNLSFRAQLVTSYRVSSRD